MNTLESLGPKKLVGLMNLAIAIPGLLQLILNVVGYYKIPPSFTDEYGPFMRHRFPAMSVATALLLPSLAILGILLLRGIKQAPALCSAFFAIEAVYFVIFLARWNMGLSPLNPVVIALGLTNAGIAIQ